MEEESLIKEFLSLFLTELVKESNNDSLSGISTSNLTEKTSHDGQSSISN
jgi:hypothetical protein